MITLEFCIQEAEHQKWYVAKIHRQKMTMIQWTNRIGRELNLKVITIMMTSYPILNKIN